MAPTYLKLVALLLSLTQLTIAIDVDWNSTASIKSAAKQMTYDFMTFYKGNLTGNPPGVLPPPFYWWQSGAMWGSIINYWQLTGDSTYNEVALQGMQYQVGEFDDYMPQEHKSSLGNDDQCFWAMTAMQAVETNFPDPPPDAPSWLGLVQAVFNEQVGRWDNETCGGGLRWQIYIKGGYDFKNTISNGCLFNIASRLARYTGEEKYANWAIKTWDWMWDLNFINHANYDIYDGAEADKQNCSVLDKLQWSYNPSILLLGTANMYNLTDGSPTWRNRTSRLLKRIDEVFFPNSTATELCEFNVLCDTDQKSFKAYLARWMTQTTILAPFTYDKIYPLIVNSAKEAAKQCIGGASKTQCGAKWYLNGTHDGSEPDVGQQMSAMEFTIGVLAKRKADGVVNLKPPVTGSTGGTSKPDPEAGSKGNVQPDYEPPPSAKDKAGAGILTCVFVLVWVAALAFMWSEAFEERKPVREKRGVERESVVLDLKGKRKAVEEEGLESIGEEEKNVWTAAATVQVPENLVPRYRGGEQVT